VWHRNVDFVVQAARTLNYCLVATLSATATESSFVSKVGYIDSIDTWQEFRLIVVLRVKILCQLFTVDRTTGTMFIRADEPQRVVQIEGWCHSVNTGDLGRQGPTERPKVSNFVGFSRELLQVGWADRYLERGHTLCIGYHMVYSWLCECNKP